VASIDELTSSLQAVVEKAEETTAGAQGAISETDELIAQALAINAEGLAADLQQVKATIENGQAQVTAAIETFGEAITQANAARGRT
jgi:hypothetical protein